MIKKSIFIYIFIILGLTTAQVQAETIREYLGGIYNDARTLSAVGQQVPTGDGTGWEDLEFNFFSAVPDVTPVAWGTLYLLDQAFIGQPDQLSAQTPGYIASAVAVNGKWRFNPAVAIAANTTYWVYTDSVSPGILSAGINDTETEVSVFATNGGDFSPILLPGPPPPPPSGPGAPPPGGPGAPPLPPPPPTLITNYRLASTPASYPVADAGEDRSVHAGGSATLDGSGSSDPDADYPLTYAWQMTYKPEDSLAELNNPSIVGPAFTPDKQGDYVFELVVTNASGLSSPADEVFISTFNSFPVAVAGEDQAVELIGSIVQLDGTQSYDDDGDTLSYEWTITSRPAGSSAALTDVNAATPSFTADANGEYRVELYVFDDWGASEPDTITISFNNVGPVTDAGNNQAVIQGETVYLDGSDSYDSNGDEITYSWSIVSAPENSQAELSDPTSETPYFTADEPGEYVVSLVVSDGIVLSETDVISIVAVTYLYAATEKLLLAVDTINQFDESVFDKKNDKKKITKKINHVLLKDIDKGKYDKAISKLEKKVLVLMDGCALRGEPDTKESIKEYKKNKEKGKKGDKIKKDSIITCEAQDQVYPMVMETLELLGNL